MEIELQRAVYHASVKSFVEPLWPAAIWHFLIVALERWLKGGTGRKRGPGTQGRRAAQGLCPDRCAGVVPTLGGACVFLPR